MKKVFIALSALVAVACSNALTIEAPKNAMIEFDNAFVENSTRLAIDITKDNINDFGVYGWVVKGDEQGQIFNNTLVYKQDGKFVYQTPQYWIGGAQYHFAALAPMQNAAWEYSPANALNGTITFDNEKAMAQQDVVFDFVSPEITPEEISSKPDAVEFNFHHILSRVKFSFKNCFAETSNITLEVTDIAISNVYAEGSIDVVNGLLDSSWNVSKEEENLMEKPLAFGNTALADGETIMASGDVATSAHLYLIPTSATYNISFSVTLYQAGVELGHYNRSATVTVNMEKGKSYELKANLNHTNTSDKGELAPIEFTVGNIGDWNTNI